MFQSLFVAVQKFNVVHLCAVECLIDFPQLVSVYLSLFTQSAVNDQL